MSFRALPVLLILVLMACGCTAFRPSPEFVVRTHAERLAHALSTDDWEGVDVRAVAEPDTHRILQGMDDLRPDVDVLETSVNADAAVARLAFTWELPGGNWEYESEVHLRKAADSSWGTQWSPQVLHPELGENTRLRHRIVPAERGRIMNSDGHILAGPHEVMRLGLNVPDVADADREKSARAIAAALDIDAEAFAQRVQGAGPQAFVEALVVRGNHSAVPEDFSEIAGALAVPDTRTLPRERGFAAELLGEVGAATAEDVERAGGTVQPGQQIGRSGLQQRYEKQLAGTPGSVVRIVDREEGTPTQQRLVEFPAVDGTDLTITLDVELQSRAEETLADVEGAASIVVVRPSTGEILVLANGPGSTGNADATIGRYAPGSTFKIVTALALIRRGQDPATPMTCHATTTLDGRTFKNYSDFPASATGPTTLRGAIAHSCNTALIEQHELITGDGLRDAAGSLGLGVDHDLGFPAFLGSVPDPANTVGVGESIIGQAAIESSPLSMAAVAASVEVGHTVVPHLIAATRPEPTATPLTTEEATQLQELMRAVVSDGSGRKLQGLADGAKTGTAEYGTGTPLRTHAWMIAQGDDLAVAVFVKDGESGSGTAGPLAAAMLTR